MEASNIIPGYGEITDTNYFLKFCFRLYQLLISHLTFVVCECVVYLFHFPHVDVYNDVKSGRSSQITFHPASIRACVDEVVGSNDAQLCHFLAWIKEWSNDAGPPNLKDKLPGSGHMEMGVKKQVI